MATTECRCCVKQIPTMGQRKCPECGRTFQGNVWYGIQRHWRTRHEHVMTYEQFWASLCEDHRKEQILP
jgi:hypothetical protein